MTNADRYIQAYKELETTVRSIFQLSQEISISHFLRNERSAAFLRTEIQYCQDVRNLLQHREKISGSYYPIIPTDEMVAYIQNTIERLRNRPRCSSIAIPQSQIFSAAMEDNLRQTINTMRKHRYTHVPILDAKRVIGVLSENSIFNYVVDEGIVDIDDNLIIRDLGKHVSMNQGDVEVFSFQPASLFVDELEEVFEKEFRKGNRLGMVFLTANGRANQDVTGILTPWDVLGHPNRRN